MKGFAFLSLALSCAPACARQITFPPVSGFHDQHLSAQGLAYDGGSSSRLANVPPFLGLTTFANLPYVHCLSDADHVEKYDIAILGAPFDTGVTARPGARFGPKGIRSGAWRISPEDAFDIFREENTMMQWAKIVDCGDAPLTFLDNTVALRQLEDAHLVISGREANASEYNTPRIITLGGDHTTTLPALRSVYRRWGPVSVIHFDSHIDTWDPAVLGGGISHYAGVNHGTFLHIAHEEGLIRNTSVHAGIRAPVNGGPRDLRNDKRCGFQIIGARDIDRHGVQGVADMIRKRVDGRVYISVDIDVLDPAFAPATGTAEVGGWSTREFLALLEALEGLEVVGADVEVAPVYDNPGETTVLAAAEIAHTLISLMVWTPVKP